MTVTKTCACGCGAKVNEGRTWRRGHGPYGADKPMHPCACGCGQLIYAESTYAKHHWHAAQKASRLAVVATELAIGERTLCACGCGQPAIKGKRWKRGHGPYTAKVTLCGCGCGEAVQPPNRYVAGHYQRTDEFKQIFTSHQWRTASAEGRARNFRAWKSGASKLNDRVEAEIKVRSIPQGYQREYKIGYYNVDFAWPAEKIVIEVQGCRWHMCAKCPGAWANMPAEHVAKQIRRDTGKRTYLENHGWAVHYIWEHDTRDGVYAVDAPFNPQNTVQTALSGGGRGVGGHSGRVALPGPFLFDQRNASATTFESRANARFASASLPSRSSM